MRHATPIRIVILLVAVAYLYPLLPIGEGVAAVPEEKRQLGLEALAGATHHFSHPIERLWTTRFRLLSFDESLDTTVVRAHTLFGIPYSDAEVEPRGPGSYVRTVRPRFWWLRRWPRRPTAAGSPIGRLAFQLGNVASDPD